MKFYRLLSQAYCDLYRTPLFYAGSLCILLFNYQASRNILTIFFSFFKLYTSLCSHSSGILQGFTNKFRHNCHLLAFTDRYSN